MATENKDTVNHSLIYFRCNLHEPEMAVKLLEMHLDVTHHGHGQLSVAPDPVVCHKVGVHT